LRLVAIQPFNSFSVATNLQAVNNLVGESDLSILSQLLPAAVIFAVLSAPKRVFQFFLSCYKRKTVMCIVTELN